MGLVIGQLSSGSYPPNPPRRLDRPDASQGWDTPSWQGHLPQRTPQPDGDWTQPRHGPHPPGYGAPSHGAPSYGAPSYGAPNYGAPGYGDRGHDAPGHRAQGHDGDREEAKRVEAERAESEHTRATERRNKVVDALRGLNSVHAQEAFDRRDKDPLAAHALAFFYHDPGADTVSSAVRLFLDDPGFADPARLLWEMHRVADGYRQRGDFDPRRHLSTHVEEMPPAFRYFGIGLSTLDTPPSPRRDGRGYDGGPWTQVRQRANSVFDVPGRCFGLLVDDTMLLLDRHAGVDRRFEIRSTHTLEIHLGQAMRMWTWGRDLADLADPYTREIWIQLQHLHALIAGADRDH